MAEEEEIRSEVEAVQSVYGDDCRVIDEFPPHLAVHFKPRTADDSSQQFVEVTLGIKSDKEYPKKPPYVYIVEMKGLDDNRQTYLISSINNKAQELSSYLMLVALCEEAVEIISNMNHPEGNCPLCLYPLVAEDKSGAALPFMKLMSCYHCFHSDCIIRLWNWAHEQNKTDGMDLADEATSATVGNKKGVQSSINQHKANCPVCRKVFNAKDMEHVLDFLGTSLSQLSYAGIDVVKEEKLFLQSDSEKNRREKFEALLKLQQENNGLIEPKKDLAIVPGMFLPANVANPSTSTETEIEQCGEGASSAEGELDSGHSVNKTTTRNHRNPDPRRKSNRFHSSKRPQHAAAPSRKQWIKKDL